MFESSFVTYQQKLVEVCFSSSSVGLATGSPFYMRTEVRGEERYYFYRAYEITLGPNFVTWWELTREQREFVLATEHLIVQKPRLKTLDKVGLLGIGVTD